METQIDILISGIQHFLYCKRQFALIHIEQFFEENLYTMRGQAIHKRVDTPADVESPNGVRIVRALPLYNDELGLVGKADVVEFNRDGIPYPVEYKLGAKKKGIHDEVQLCAQALCLEFMFKKNVPEGAIFHASSKRRRQIKIDDSLRRITLDAIGEMRELVFNGIIPEPISNNRCTNCSLVNYCQPHLVNSFQSELSKHRKNLFQVSQEKFDLS